MLQIQREAGLAFSRRTYDAGTVLSPHTHQLSYLSFAGRGAYREAVGRTIRECPSQTLLFHPAGETHSNEFLSGPVELLRVEAEDSSLLDRIATTSPMRDQTCGRIGRRMLIELRDPDALTPMVLHGLALELVASILRWATAIDTAPRWLRRADDILAESLCNPPTLKELAALSNVHPVHLCRTYRLHYGQTIGERLRELRLRRAYELLAYTQMSVGEVAAACGFCDQSFLARCMRTSIGISPREYRNGGFRP